MKKCIRVCGTTLALGCLVVIASVGEAEEVPWSLRPLVRPDVPPAGEWAGNAIDAFILTKLEEAGLAPSPPAGRRQLIRRVYFDLTGLPPKPGEVAAFVSDPSPDAYEKLVDRLLASPRFGERWARHWMDLVHYAETHGHDEDAIRENAWPYRDYLIRSFNEDKPYARFVAEQVAGDVLYPDDPWATVATGLLACGPWDESSQMGIQDGTTDKKIAQYLDRDDMISTVMSTFVSATVHCARCHDHKFDPISTDDYYALQAVFAGVDRVDRAYQPDPERKRVRTQLLARKSLLDGGELPAELRDDPGRQSEFALWLGQAKEAASGWALLEDVGAVSEGKASVEILPDGSLRFGGDRPERDTYRIDGRVAVDRVTGVLLEVLADESLPMGGPGRQDNGNLHLSEVRLSASGRELTIAAAVADFNQGGWTIEHAIDGNPQTAWGIFPEVGKAHRALFTLSAEGAPLAGERLTVVLEQLHGGGHLIGRPRLWVTTHPSPKF